MWNLPTKGVKKYKQPKNELIKETDKAITGQNIVRNNSKVIKEKNGMLLKEKDDIKGRWREYKTKTKEI